MTRGVFEVIGLEPVRRTRLAEVIAQVRPLRLPDPTPTLTWSPFGKTQP